MAASAWQLYDTAMEKLMDGTIDLDSADSNFRLHLYTTGNDAGTLTQSALSELSSELASAGGYTLSGKAMVVTWTVGASAREWRFDASDMVMTATGANWTDVRTAVIVYQTGSSAKDPTNALLCKANLSTDAFTVTDTNTLTLTFPAGGIFELNQV
jgi:hypothetical protein